MPNIMLASQMIRVCCAACYQLRHIGAHTRSFSLLLLLFRSHLGLADIAGSQSEGRFAVESVHQGHVHACRVVEEAPIVEERIRAHERIIVPPRPKLLLLLLLWLRSCHLSLLRLCARHRSKVRNGGADLWRVE